MYGLSSKESYFLVHKIIKELHEKYPRTGYWMFELTPTCKTNAYWILAEAKLTQRPVSEIVADHRKRMQA